MDCKSIIKQMLTVLALCLPVYLWGQSIDPGGTVSISAYNSNPYPPVLLDAVKNVNFWELQLRCQSQFAPVEWIFDDLFSVTGELYPCEVSELTIRDWGSAKYEASLNFQSCKELRTGLVFVCRAVTDHLDNILVTLEPNNSTGLIHVVQNRSAGEILTEDIRKSSSDNTSACVRFTVARMADGGSSVWRCEGQSGEPGAVKFLHCGFSSAGCANFRRRWKSRSVCVVRSAATVSAADITTDTTEPGWRNLVNEKNGLVKPWTAVCEGSGGQYEPGALEFFVTWPNWSTPYFSIKEVSMSNLIWFIPDIPPLATYYTPESFDTACYMSYGFSMGSEVQILRNGSRLRILENDFDSNLKAFNINVSLDFRLTGPGHYEIICRGPVWNSSEWITRKLKLYVRNAIQPFFESPNENVTFEQWDSSKVLECDPTGEPSPVVVWNQEVVYPLRREGSQFTLNRPLAELLNGSTLSCVATNRLNQSAIKLFRIFASSAPKSANANSTVSWTPIAIITLLVLIVAALCVGFGHMYCRFVRLGLAVNQALTEEEVEQFFEGRLESIPLVGLGADIVDQVGFHGDEEELNADLLPYNSAYEVAKENFHVDFDTELGSGEYGVVFLGEIKQDEGQAIRVAVKTVRPNVPKEYFNALLSELKILAHIGTHDNVAKLVGAYTSNIRQFELWVGIEHCKTSLLKYLRQYSGILKNYVDPPLQATSFSQYMSNEQHEKLIQTQLIPLRDLVRWSAETASGMEYLSQKRVVHSDLAARNVLLSFDLHAKICDFGLARQMVNYEYTKKTDCRLPWQWMSIESLRQMHFSTASDVWAYGVTCWEIFSLGDVPYPGMAWSCDFVSGLESGNRLAKPRHASSLVYSTLRKCWHEKRENRPKFSDLKDFFEGQLQQMEELISAKYE